MLSVWARKRLAQIFALFRVLLGIFIRWFRTLFVGRGICCIIWSIRPTVCLRLFGDHPHDLSFIKNSLDLFASAPEDSFERRQVPQPEVTQELVHRLSELGSYASNRARCDPNSAFNPVNEEVNLAVTDR